MTDRDILNDLNERIDQFTLAQAVIEYNDFFEYKKDEFRSNLFDAPDKLKLIEVEVKEIDRIMSHQEPDYFDIPTEAEYLRYKNRIAKNEPTNALPVNHGGTELVRYGFREALQGGTKKVQYLRINQYPNKEMKYFVESETPPYFLLKLPEYDLLKNIIIDSYGRGISDEITRVSQIAWLEGFFYIIRGGNYAFYYSWLKEQREYLTRNGRLEIEDIKLVKPLGEDLAIRILLLDRLGLLKVMADKLDMKINSVHFCKIMAQVLDTTPGAIEKHLRLASDPFGYHRAGYKTPIRTANNYGEIIQAIDDDNIKLPRKILKQLEHELGELIEREGKSEIK